MAAAAAPGAGDAVATGPSICDMAPDRRAAAEVGLGVDLGRLAGLVLSSFFFVLRAAISARLWAGDGGARTAGGGGGDGDGEPWTHEDLLR